MIVSSGSGLTDCLCTVADAQTDTRVDTFKFVAPLTRQDNDQFGRVGDPNVVAIESCQNPGHYLRVSTSNLPLLLNLNRQHLLVRCFSDRRLPAFCSIAGTKFGPVCSHRKPTR